MTRRGREGAAERKEKGGMRREEKEVDINSK